MASTAASASSSRAGSAIVTPAPVTPVTPEGEIRDSSQYRRLRPWATTSSPPRQTDIQVMLSGSSSSAAVKLPQPFWNSSQLLAVS